MKKFKIFIVDDDPWYGEMLEYYLSMNPDYELERFTTAKDCITALSRKPDLITLDYSLPDGTGEDVLKKLRAATDVPVIIISAQEDITTAIGLLKAGATDYLVKDENTKDLLWNAVIRIRENRELKKEVESLKEELGHKHNIEKSIKGSSAPMQKVFALIAKAAGTSINVTITGETGTGKELVAKAIHYNSERQKKPFVAINMAAIPKELIESELFGHEKGAFTGALTRKIGKFEEANKGTLFLDEVGEADLNLQSKLLRVMQERELVRVGGNEKVPLDVRIITATHRNLADEVRKGNFREDLYYRMIGMPVHLPPLRERGSDILVLAKFFADDFCRHNKMNEVIISPDAKDKLVAYYYPGNIRELKAAVDLAAVMCSDNKITAEDINFNPVTKGDSPLLTEKTLKGYTIDIITTFLKKYDNNVLKVSEKLDIGKSTIYKMIKDGEIVVD